MRLSFPRLLIALVALAMPAFAAATDLPSEGLENRIDFWKKVYTQYGENDVIIHDRVRVNLIYDVAVRGEHQSKIAAVQQALDDIRQNLATPETLSPTSIAIRDVIEASGLPMTPSVLAELRENVHTQLGIKERFREGIIRSGRYLNTFQTIFGDAGLPTEIALLPLVESSF